MHTVRGIDNWVYEILTRVVNPHSLVLFFFSIPFPPVVVHIVIYRSSARYATDSREFIPERSSIRKYTIERYTEE